MNSGSATSLEEGKLSELANALAMIAVGELPGPLPLPLPAAEPDEAIREIWTAAELLRQDLEAIERIRAEANLRGATYSAFLEALNNAGDDAELIINSLDVMIGQRYVDLCSLQLVHPDRTLLDWRGSYHADRVVIERIATFLNQEPQLASAGCVGRALRANEPVHIGDIDSSRTHDDLPAHIASIIDVFPISDLAVVPIRVDGHPIGVIEVCRGLGREALDEADLALVANVADRLGLALERARQQDKLRALQRALESINADLVRSNQDLQELAFVASHDLQEPARVVVSLLGLLSKHNPDLDEKSLDYLRRARGAAQRSQALINDLLDYSRIGGASGPRQTVATSEVVSAVLVELAGAIGRRGAAINVGELPDVSGRPDLIRRVFQNLIANALEYSGDRPPVITVAAVRSTADPRFWQFSISDNGVGFEPRFADEIFAVFRRLGPRDGHSGTGIGLAICKRIVVRHGGNIWAESRPGAGSVFHFTLPGES